MYYAMAEAIRLEHFQNYPNWSWRGMKEEAGELSPSPLIDGRKPRSDTGEPMAFEDSGLPVLQLAPTPAQLRQMRAKPAETVTSKSGATPPLNYVDSPEFLERLKTLPVFDYVNYRSLTLWPTFAPALNPDARLMETYEKKVRPDTDSNKRKEYEAGSEPKRAKKQLTGNIFFGPDFNPAAFARKWVTMDRLSFDIPYFFYFFSQPAHIATTIASASHRQAQRTASICDR